MDICFLIHVYLPELFLNFGSKYFQILEFGKGTLSDSLHQSLTYYCAQNGQLFYHQNIIDRIWTQTFSNVGIW